jgi:hypothetical protein
MAKTRAELNRPSLVPIVCKLDNSVVSFGPVPYNGWRERTSGRPCLRRTLIPIGPA